MPPPTPHTHPDLGSDSADPDSHPDQVKRISRYAHLVLTTLPGQADRPPLLLAQTVTAQEKNHGVVINGGGKRVLASTSTEVHDGATLHLSQVHDLSQVHGLSVDLAFTVRYVRRGAESAEARHVWEDAWGGWRKGRLDPMSSSEESVQ